MQITETETQTLIEEKMQQMQDKYGNGAKLLMLEIVMLKDNMYKQNKTRYIPVPDWNIYHPYPTVSAIRNYINNSANNGFDKVYFKKGKKNFIDENKFFEWFKGGNNG